MSEFLSGLEMKRGPNKDWVLTKPLFYASDAAKTTFLVPAGFETDLDSVPRLPFAYAIFKGLCDEAAVVHDWLYSEGQVRRDLADTVFREAMQVCGVPAGKRWAIWAAVRLGGTAHYNGKRG